MASALIETATTKEYRDAILSYATKGYTTIASTASSTTLSRKKPFNWVLAIICLFIPIIGWIALGYMLTASRRGSDVVEIVLNVPSASARERLA